eukprot:1611538-Pyramimonas_sp.AAC.1
MPSKKTLGQSSALMTMTVTMTMTMAMMTLMTMMMIMMMTTTVMMLMLMMLWGSLEAIGYFLCRRAAAHESNGKPRSTDSVSKAQNS